MRGKFIYLKGDIDTIWQRHHRCESHYFNGHAMLESQFPSLVKPTKEEASIIDSGTMRMPF